MKTRVVIIALSLFILYSCDNRQVTKERNVIIFHAGSLSVPFSKLREEYEKKNPGVKILLEPAGSLVCARKITELKKPCDIMASADYFVINELLIPDYTHWGIRFATNEIVIAYTSKSEYADEINQGNWMDVLQRDDVIYGRSDPDNDPCGYRTVIVFHLAEKYYNSTGLSDKFISKNKDYIRPKEVDLVALMESNAIDYMFQYKSVAIQHGLKFIELPDEINLGNPGMNEKYNKVVIDVNGSKPGEKIKVTGEYINYSLTVLNNAPNSKDAIGFISFLLSREGIEILKQNGQEAIIPVTSDQPDMVPPELRKYLN
jgi:molybdate/tungstate transport system substrate-binding protein